MPNNYASKLKKPGFCENTSKTYAKKTHCSDKSSLLSRNVEVEFKDKCDRASESAKMRLKGRVERLQLRLQRLSESAGLLESVLAEEIGTETALIEAIVAGIRQPRISVEIYSITFERNSAVQSLTSINFFVILSSRYSTSLASLKKTILAPMPLNAMARPSVTLTLPENRSTIPIIMIKLESTAAVRAALKL